MNRVCMLMIFKTVNVWFPDKNILKQKTIFYLKQQYFPCVETQIFKSKIE